MRIHRSPGLAAIVVLTAAALSLSACAPAESGEETPSAEKTPAAEQASTAPTPDATAEDAPEDTDATAPSTLSFTDGNDLDPSIRIEWADGLLADDGWKVVSEDNGDGGWTYGTVDGSCTAAFWQGYISDVDTQPGGDSATSDEMLALLLNTDVSEFAEYVGDGAFSYQVGGNLELAHRQIAGQQEEVTWLMAARAFTATGVGAYVIIDCTNADPYVILDEINEKNPIVAY